MAHEIKLEVARMLGKVFVYSVQQIFSKMCKYFQIYF